MRTAVVSDLHLGLGNEADLLRRADIRETLSSELDGVDRLILLGDVLELRDRPLAEALDAAAPVLEQLGAALGADAEIIVVPGNHDHHLIEDWLQRRALAGDSSLELEHRDVPEGGALAVLAEQAAPAPLSFAYPGLWLRDDVYATHGHYLDRHQTIPTLERLGVALVERLLGMPAGGPDPLAPPDEDPDEVAEYERVQAPVYAFLFALAQATVGERSGGADPSVRVWQMLSGKPSSPVAKVRGWLLGSVALPGAVGVANRLGLGPVGSDLSPRAITRAALTAMAEVVERLGIDADHVIFGHTHRRGPNGDEPGWEAGKARLWNTGSWVHSPTLLGPTASQSPYWPGTVAFVEDDGPPRLVHLLDDLSREDLAGH